MIQVMCLREKIMEASRSARFELRGSRTSHAVMTVICAMVTVSLVALYFLNLRTFSYLHHSSLLLASLLSIFAILAAYSAACWLRQDPLLVIDDRGITDYGGVGWEGYGLLPWQSIEDIQTLSARGGVYLAVKVNNFEELVSRRGRPFWPMITRKLYGEKILLRMAYSDAEKARNQIPYYSNNKFY
jgi:hypothetical protein